MFARFRTRLLVALSLACAAPAATACKKADDEAGPVDDEGKKKPKPKPDPPPKKKKDWVPSDVGHGGSCPTEYFCTNDPEIAQKADDDDAYGACGKTAKVPASIHDEFGGRPAWLHPSLTKKERARGEPDACCYSYRTGPCGKGRPLRHEGALVLATERRVAGWAGFDAREVAAAVSTFPASEVAVLVDHLRRVALLEHGSIAAFASVSLELLVLGAPADLVEAAHVAALDEIRHARTCWSLVAELSGEERGPSAMRLPPLAAPDVERMLVDTVIDGCVGEALGSLLFEAAADRCVVPELAAVYRAIAAEEAEHALLAFRICRFLLELRPDLEERALDVALSAERAALGGPSHEALGLLDEETQQRVLDRGFDEVVRPVLFALVSPFARAAA